MKIEIEVTPARIADLMTSAIEGGSNYWCGGVYLRSPARGEKGVPWYARPEVWADPDLRVDVVGEDGSYTMTQASIKAGLEHMAKKYCQHFSDILGETDDAATADLFLQLAALGDEVYA